MTDDGYTTTDLSNQWNLKTFTISHTGITTVICHKLLTLWANCLLMLNSSVLPFAPFLQWLVPPYRLGLSAETKELKLRIDLHECQTDSI